MKKSLRVGVMGAGLGSRLQSLAKAKPLAMIGDTTLVHRLAEQLLAQGPENVTFALREELLSAADKAGLPELPRTKFIYVNTESSLHTLVELVRAMGQERAALLSMVDTILRDEDLAAFWNFCARLNNEECAVLVTPFVDDEKPLWVQVDESGRVTKFGAERGPYVTSGMYFLGPRALKIAEELTQSGVHKMRNFLSNLVERGVVIKTFVVQKTIDVDHPSDLEMASHFLRGTKGSSS